MISKHQFAQVEAMGRDRGGEGSYTYDPQRLMHTLSISGGGREKPSYLAWQGRGDISMVKSSRKGDASRIHAEARSLSEGNPDIPKPLHSDKMTTQGMHWANKERRKYGEPVPEPPRFDDDWG